MRQKTMPKKCCLRLGLTCILLSAVGCDQKQVQEAVDKGVEQTTHVLEQTVETVKQETKLAGSMDLSTDPPLAAKACYVELIDTGEGRPNVLRLASYKSSDLERFPSILVEAHVTETSLADLKGKTISATIYAQLEEDGVVHATETGSPASIAILSVDENSLTCECRAAQLTSSDTGLAKEVTGKFVAVLN